MWLLHAARHSSWWFRNATNCKRIHITYNYKAQKYSIISVTCAKLISSHSECAPSLDVDHPLVKRRLLPPLVVGSLNVPYPWSTYRSFIPLLMKGIRGVVVHKFPPRIANAHKSTEQGVGQHFIDRLRPDHDDDGNSFANYYNINYYIVIKGGPLCGVAPAWRKLAMRHGEFPILYWTTSFNRAPFRPHIAFSYHTLHLIMSLYRLGPTISYYNHILFTMPHCTAATTKIIILLCESRVYFKPRDDKN